MGFRNTNVDISYTHATLSSDVETSDIEAWPSKLRR